MEHRESYTSPRDRLENLLQGRRGFHGKTSKGSVGILFRNGASIDDDGSISVHVRPAVGRPPIKEFVVDKNGRVSILSNDGKADFTLDEILNELGA